MECKELLTYSITAAIGGWLLALTVLTGYIILLLGPHIRAWKEKRERNESHPRNFVSPQ